MLILYEFAKILLTSKKNVCYNSVTEKERRNKKMEVTKLYVVVYDGKKHYFTTECERNRFLNLKNATDKKYYVVKIQKYTILLEDI